ncbi:hypothetical protein MLD38_021769 [Melastoma candidum]|uniref:Uncharacterized protein n=1 Tax=Melastoma candidum TaxID=119954 RepID=A0ACB9QIA7_9MYRT|nr:hypothetical protein MLD38_021769 [Melastoma candidum]
MGRGKGESFEKFSLIEPSTCLLRRPSQPPSQQPNPPLPLGASSSPLPQERISLPQKKPVMKTSVDSMIATSLTRRFGLGAGLTWVGFLAVGVLSEQIKTRWEVSQQQANTRNVEKVEEVVLPNGIRCTTSSESGGASLRPGDLVVIDLKGTIQESGKVFADTFEGDKKPLALVMGSRPYSKGVCEGIEYVLRSMKAGGTRRVIIPPNLGFGEKGADFGTGVRFLALHLLSPSSRSVKSPLRLLRELHFPFPIYSGSEQ